MGLIYIKKKDGERLGSQIQSIKNALYVGIHFNIWQEILNDMIPKWIFDKLHEWHFDTKGLIKKDLAIDINTLK